jgi:hypothetical protein
MTKLSLFGVAVVAACTAFAVPAFAQHRANPSLNAYAQTGSCAGYEPGNPYNRDTDFLSWSAWRVRGGWDDRNDYKCTPTHISHGEF